MIKTVYLVISATGDVRVGTRPRIAADEVAFQVRLHFPDGWGKVQAKQIELTIPDPPALLDQPERVSPVNPDRCDPVRGYHSTPHRGCMLRGEIEERAVNHEGEFLHD